MAKSIDNGGLAQIGSAKPDDSEVVSFDGNVQSGTLGMGIHKITVMQDCFMEQGVNPAAVVNDSEIMKKDSVQFINIIKKDNKLAFIKLTDAGKAYITPYI